MDALRPSHIAAGLLSAGLATALVLAHPASAGTPEMGLAERAATLRDDGWSVTHSRHEVLVLSRGVPGSSVQEVRAIAVSSASLARLMAVVTAYADYPSFLPYVVRSEVLPSPDGITRVFQQLDFPPPVSDRRFTVRLIPFRSPHDGSTGVTWTLETAPEFQRGTTGLQPTVYEGSWTFLPLGGGTTTLVEYFARSDPGGWVPRWAVDLAMRHSVPRVVMIIMQRAAAGP